jgi:peptide/nickel transport system permease protein
MISKLKRLEIGNFSQSLGRNPARLIGGIGIGTIVLLCLIVPLLSPYPPNAFVAEPFLPPSWAHPFGTDLVGRDVFVRTFAGGRVDLIAASLTTLFALVVGTVLGTWAGSSKSKWVDIVLMRTVDGVIAFPMMILLLALVVVIGGDRTWGGLPAGLPAAMAAMMCVQWAVYARLASSQARTLRNSDFVTAARISGLSELTILFRYVVPGVSRVTRAYAIGDVVFVVIVLSSLPFLGAGVQPPVAEWGSILYEGRGFLLQAWWITLLPGAVLAFTGLSLSFFADSYIGQDPDHETGGK